MQPSKFPRFRYSLFKLITHLLIPFATIPVGILFYYGCTATLPDKDIHTIKTKFVFPNTTVSKFALFTVSIIKTCYR